MYLLKYLVEKEENRKIYEELLITLQSVNKNNKIIAIYQLIFESINKNSLKYLQYGTS